MEISGLVKSSLIDYPEKIAAVVFTQGCNFRCGFCHNPDLSQIKKGLLKEDDLFDFLAKRKGKLDGVVVTGGEPTIHKDLETFITKIKEMGYLVKLDTNGSNPEVLKILIDKELIDFVAMDIKGALGQYSEISKYMNTKVIQASINIIKENKIPYEFRTTVLPYYHSTENIEEIGKLLKGAKLFTVQGFRPQNTLDKTLEKEKSFTRDELNEIAKTVKRQVNEVQIHDNL